MAMGGLVWQASRPGGVGEFDPPDLGMKGMASLMPNLDSDEVFDLGVQAIIEGLHTQLSVRTPGV